MDSVISSPMDQTPREMASFEEQIKTSLSNAYDIERELGGGGMSRVFVATDRLLGRKIVIKFLSPELIAEVNRGRFRREIQVAAQLQHPHIVTLLSAGEDGDLVYYTMPFIEGESLKSAVEKNGRCYPGSVRCRRRSRVCACAWRRSPRHQAGKYSAVGLSCARH